MQFHGNQFLKSGSTEWIFLPLFQGEMPKLVLNFGVELCKIGLSSHLLGDCSLKIDFRGQHCLALYKKKPGDDLLSHPSGGQYHRRERA